MERIAESQEQEESEMVKDSESETGDKHGADESGRSICGGEEDERGSIMCVG